MAINQNPSLPNRHTGYIACSGYGKSQALKQNSEIPKRGARVLLWDADEDHRATHYTNWKQYVRAVREAMRSGHGFRLAWAGDVSEEQFELFCQLCWICLDGKRPLFIIIEELADVQKSIGKASNWFGQLCRKSRKYNGIMHWTSQRVEEIPKTAVSQSNNFYIGFPNDTATKQQVEKLARIARAQGGAGALYKLEPLQFYRKIGRESSLITLKYKNL